MRLEETNILFIEDDMAACKSLPPILKSYGFKVNTANTFRQAHPRNRSKHIWPISYRY